MDKNRSIKSNIKNHINRTNRSLIRCNNIYPHSNFIYYNTSTALAGTEVLTPTRVEENQSIAVTYSDGSEGTLSNTVITEITNFNSQQHMLTCQTQITSTTKSFKQLIIPTGLDFTGRQTDSHNATAALVNGTKLILGLVHIYVEDNQLMVKVVFSETPEYTSMQLIN